MVWQLEWGEYYEKITAAGGKLKNLPPDLDEFEISVYECLIDLSGDRNMNGDIPLSALIAWGKFNRIPRIILYDYWEIIKILSQVVSKWRQRNK